MAFKISNGLFLSRRKRGEKKKKTTKDDNGGAAMVTVVKVHAHTRQSHIFITRIILFAFGPQTFNKYFLPFLACRKNCVNELVIRRKWADGGSKSKVI